MKERGQISLFDQPASEPRAADPANGATGAEALPDPAANRIGKFHAPESQAPSTEREAAILVYPRTGTARLRVLEYLMGCGDRGATDEEIAETLRMRLYTAAPRRNELVNDGWVENSGKRRPTTTGSQAVVWVVTARGRQELARRPAA